MKYFTSDLHINHANILNKQNRPFMTVRDMDEALIDNICSIVAPEDELYFLGDIVMGEDLEYGLELLRRIKCHKFLIKGNHDKKKERYGNVFEDITKYMEVHDKERHIILCLSHYPFLCWHHQNSGSIMLHGHIHSDSSYNSINRDLGLKRYDVGVDANNYRPVSLDNILDFFSNVEKPDKENFSLSEYLKMNLIPASKDRNSIRSE